MLRIYFLQIGTVFGLIAAPVMSSAERITLTSVDNTVQITGEFVGFDQNKYLVDVNGYTIALPVTSMICEGSDCLGFAPLPATQRADS